MTQRRSGLGRGLSALINEVPVTDKPHAEPSADTGPTKIALAKIVRSTVQPRHTFEQEPMEDLVRSVSERGVLQPLLVRAKGDGYELIAGERRMRAALQAGLAEVPVIITEADDRVALELALIENLQRENLNVVDEADGYKALADDFGLTQEDIAQRVGKARASVANVMRLLDLPVEIRDMLVESKLSQGHAKVLLAVEIDEEKILLARRVVSEGMSVRDLEKVVNRVQREPKKPRARREDIPKDYIVHLNDQLKRHFGTSVKVQSSSTYANGKKAKGKVEIEYYSSDDLNRILDIVGLSSHEIR